MTDLAAQALDYAARGWPVVPLHNPAAGRCSCGRPDCGSVAKHPRVTGGLNAATLERAQIETWWQRWPQANIGIRTGAVSGLVVVDIDPAHGGNDTISRLQRRHGRLEQAIEVETGSLGSHLYFAHPGGNIRNDAGRRLGPGVDIRGDGGYIVAPPSVHATGRPYRWLNAATQLPAMPDWMQERLAAREVPQRRLDSPDQDYARRALSRAAHDVARAPVGTRNNTLNRAAYRMGRLVESGAVPRYVVETTLEATATANGLPPREARATITSALDGASRKLSPTRARTLAGRADGLGRV